MSNAKLQELLAVLEKCGYTATLVHVVTSDSQTTNGTRKPTGEVRLTLVPDPNQ
jgi:hypothetical protein